MATEQPLESDAVIWPGEFLAGELEARGMSQRQLAAQMGRPQQAVNEIVHGKKALTAETAVELERALGIPAYLWLRMEARYRLALSRPNFQASRHETDARLSTTQFREGEIGALAEIVPTVCQAGKRLSTVVCLHR